MDTVPATLAEVLDPGFIGGVLGEAIAAVETVEVIRTVATKVRFRAAPADGGPVRALCVKGLLDVDAMTARGGATMVKEADFYGRIAGAVDVRVPVCVRGVVDRDAQQALVFMRDLIGDGARFCSAHEPFSADAAADSLGQLARLHAGRGLLASNPWITRRVSDLAEMKYVTVEQLQDMLDGPRGTALDGAARDAGRLVAGLRALAVRDAERPQFLVHGDAHAGNIFVDGQGRAGLIDWQLLQAGGWALDVAYHLCAVLPVALAESEERRLLAHYLAEMRALDCAVPDAEEAWRQYREATVYGYYLWGITRRVAPEIIRLFITRLGSAVARHGAFDLLGV